MDMRLKCWAEMWGRAAWVDMRLKCWAEMWGRAAWVDTRLNGWAEMWVWAAWVDMRLNGWVVMWVRAVGVDMTLKCSAEVGERTTGMDKRFKCGGESVVGGQEAQMMGGYVDSACGDGLEAEMQFRGGGEDDGDGKRLKCWAEMWVQVAWMDTRMTCSAGVRERWGWTSG